MKKTKELTCNVVTDLMLLHTSGKTSPETRQMVETHLETCAACAQAFGREPHIRGRIDIPRAYNSTELDTLLEKGKYYLLPLWGFILFLLTRMVSMMDGLLRRFGISTTGMKIRLYRARRNVAGVTAQNTVQDAGQSNL